MEKEIKIMMGTELDEVIHILKEYDTRGKRVYCIFNGHILHSHNITYDTVYMEVFGCTKSEYDKRVSEIIKKEKERIFREQEYRKKVKASRSNNKRIITMELVIKGLKFIAEHQKASQEELIEGLLELGCDFSLEDINKQFPQEIPMFLGMKQCDLSCGATIIVNTRDSEFNRTFCEECFLSKDDEISVYHFIRVVTGDETYTKEKVDSLCTPDIKKYTKR